MRDFVDRVSWPARRYLCDRLVGQRAYSRNVTHYEFLNPVNLDVSSYGSGGTNAVPYAIEYTRNPGETA